MGTVSSCVTETCAPATAILRPNHSDTGIFDVYEIGDIIGSGAFGQVRACWLVGEKDDGAYAVKVIDTQAENQLTASEQLPATEEARILQSVRHPHIVELIDIFQEDRWLFVVEERCAWELFAAFADKRHNVTESCVAVVGHQLLQALQHLHDRNIVHRDVKAENIMLSSLPSASGKWEIKLVDFGLATRMEQQPLFLRICRDQGDMPYDEIICGTAYYCAPEVWANGYGPKVDVWAAGVTLYLALFGNFPFYDKDPNAIEAMICQDGLEPPWKPACATEHPGYQVSQAAQECLAGLLEKDVSERPGAGKALKDAWLRRGRSLQRVASPKKHLAANAAATSSESDPAIPIGVRMKAGRAAARAPVSVAKEQGRTAALEALKAEALAPKNSTSRAKVARSHPTVAGKLSTSRPSRRALVRELGSPAACVSRASQDDVAAITSKEIDYGSEDEGEDSERPVFCS